MSAHTPGPWDVHYCAADTLEIHPLADEDGDTVIADICPQDCREPVTDAATRGANARLIAAAPELLAALRSARAWVAQYAELRGHEAASASMLRVIDPAIAKAGAPL